MSFAADASGLGDKAQVTVPAAKRLTPLAALEVRRGEEGFGCWKRVVGLGGRGHFLDRQLLVAIVGLDRHRFQIPDDAEQR